jgi:hypothetical protein
MATTTKHRKTSRQNLLDHATGDICQTKIATRVTVRQRFMVQSQLMQNRGVQVVRVNFVLSRGEP